MITRRSCLCFAIPTPPANAFYRITHGKLVVLPHLEPATDATPADAKTVLDVAAAVLLVSDSHPAEPAVSDKAAPALPPHGADDDSELPPQPFDVTPIASRAAKGTAATGDSDSSDDENLPLYTAEVDRALVTTDAADAAEPSFTTDATVTDLADDAKHADEPEPDVTFATAIDVSGAFDDTLDSTSLVEEDEVAAAEAPSTPTAEKASPEVTLTEEAAPVADEDIGSTREDEVSSVIVEVPTSVGDHSTEVTDADDVKSADIESAEADVVEKATAAEILEDETPAADTVEDEFPVDIVEETPEVVEEIQAVAEETPKDIVEEGPADVVEEVPALSTRLPESAEQVDAAEPEEAEPLPTDIDTAVTEFSEDIEPSPYSAVDSDVTSVTDFDSQASTPITPVGPAHRTRSRRKRMASKRGGSPFPYRERSLIAQVLADFVGRIRLRWARRAATEAAAVDLSATQKRVPPPDEQQHERAVKDLTGKIDDLNKQQVRAAVAVKRNETE